MNIEKGLTLSQFVDSMKLSNLRCAGDILPMIENYNDILKKPLLEEMFINPLRKPLREHYGFIDSCSFDEDSEWTSEAGESEYYKAINAWTNAQKKVISDCYVNSDFRSGKRLTFNSEDVYMDIDFDNFTNVISVINVHDDRSDVRTLHDLFEAVGCGLILKNVNV